MKKVLAILLAMVMVLSMLPLTAFAATTVVTYEKVTTAPDDWSGTYVIVYEEGNKIFNGSLTTLDATSNYVDVTIADSVVTTANLTGYEFTIAAMDGGYSIQAASGKYIGHSSDANKITSSDTALLNTLSINDDGSVNIICAGGAYLRYNATSGQDRFRYFKSSSYTNQKAICLYAKVETEVSCNHEGTTTTVQGAKDATCTVDGYTGDTVCECGATIEYGSAITAPGHTESSVVTAATCTTDGYTTYTCSVCDNVRTDDTVAATGHTLVDGVCSVCGVKQSSAQKASAIAVGDKVIIVCESKQVELSSFNGTSYANGTAYTDAPMGLYIWTIATGASDGTYAFVDSEGAYLAWSSSNSAKTSDTLDANSSWTVSFDEEGNALIANAADATRLLKWNASSPRFACYTSTQTAIQIYTVVTGGGSEGGEGGSEPEPEVTEPEVTEPEVTEPSATPCPDENHTFVDGVCTKCGEAEPIGPIDPSDPTEPETPAGEVKIVFQLGENKEAVHADGTSATTYTETVSGYTLNITEGTKMYTGAVDAQGNGCIKLGTSSAVGGFEFTVPADVREVVICVAKYKAKATIISVNGTEYTLENSSDNGAYDEITVDTSSDKTVTLTTVSGGARAMVNSITFVCGEKDHDCQWDNGTVTTEATCTTDGVMTYSCTVDGCTITTTEKIPAGHKYDADGNCTACGLTPAQVVANAYALESGASLEGKYTLTGVIKGIDTAYDESYQNVSVIIDVIGVTDMPILCYRMKGEGADVIGTGDTITVTGTLKNYNSTIEFDAGCTLDSWQDTGIDFVAPTTPEEIVNAAYALEVGTTLEKGPYTLTGVITSVDYAYSANNKDITIVIQIGDMADKLIKCYRLKGEGAELICVGDTVTVTGNLKNYNGTVEFDSGCTLDSYVINKGHTEEIDAAVEATCTTAGLTEGKHCSVCSLVIVAQEEVAGHTIEHVEAVVPANCQETGHDEYWYCATCDIYYGDAEYSYQLNPAWLYYTGDHVRPEGAAVCAVVTCTLCGEDSYGESCDRGDAPVCQDATCVNCGETVWGWGCNYNTGDEEVPLPLCQPGDCVYCGTHYEKLYDCENGAWAACLDGECSYGCGKLFPATEDHTVDPCVGGMCEVCWTTFEGGHTMVDGVCSVCNYDENLKFAQVGLSFQEYIGLQVLVPVNSSYDRIYVNAVQAEPDGDTSEDLAGEVVFGTYLLFDKQVLSWSMTDDITLTIYAEKGDVVYQGETVTTSVAKLALEKLAGYSTTDEARARALADMLNYGASVQTAYSHRADKLANAELGEYASFATTEEPVFDAEDIITGEGSVSVLQYGVSMRSKVEMQFMFTEASIVGCELRIMINGETTEIAADQFEAFSGYAVARVAIKAANLHEIHTIALYNAETGEVVTPVYNVSIEAYAKTQLGGTYNDVFVEMMKYGDAVAAIA